MDFKLIAGLGNPTPTYRHTYHNAGFLFVSFLVKILGGRLTKTGTRVTLYKAGEFFLALPASFMNVSGAAVAQALAKTKVSPSKLLVAHDDADLPLGSFRFSFARGSAGHRGVESVFQALGTREFWRLRLGIRPPAGGVKSPPACRQARRPKAGAFVLSRLSPRDRRALHGVFRELVVILKLMENAAEPSG